MANINQLEIVKSLAQEGIVIVKHGFMGFGGKVVKADTGVTLKAFEREYVPAEGDKMLRLLQLDAQALLDGLRSSKPAAVGLGNMRLEGLLAEDGSELLVQMYRYVDFHSTPVSDLKRIEGSAAAEIAAQL